MAFYGPILLWSLANLLVLATATGAEALLLLGAAKLVGLGGLGYGPVCLTSSGIAAATFIGFNAGLYGYCLLSALCHRDRGADDRLIWVAGWLSAYAAAVAAGSGLLGWLSGIGLAAALPTVTIAVTTGAVLIVWPTKMALLVLWALAFTGAIWRDYPNTPRPGQRRAS